MRICEINGESNELGSSDQDRDDDDGGVGGARRCLGECFGVRFGVAAVGGERTPFACCCIMSEYSILDAVRGTCLLFHTIYSNGSSWRSYCTARKRLCRAPDLRAVTLLGLF